MSKAAVTNQIPCEPRPTNKRCVNAVNQTGYSFSARAKKDTGNPALLITKHIATFGHQIEPNRGRQINLQSRDPRRSLL